MFDFRHRNYFEFDFRHRIDFPLIRKKIDFYQRMQFLLDLLKFLQPNFVQFCKEFHYFQQKLYHNAIWADKCKKKNTHVLWENRSKAKWNSFDEFFAISEFKRIHENF